MKRAALALLLLGVLAGAQAHPTRQLRQQVIVAPPSSSKGSTNAKTDTGSKFLAALDALAAAKLKELAAKKDKPSTAAQTVVAPAQTVVPQYIVSQPVMVAPAPSIPIVAPARPAPTPSEKSFSKSITISKDGIKVKVKGEDSGASPVPTFDDLKAGLQDLANKIKGGQQAQPVVAATSYTTWGTVNTAVAPVAPVAPQLPASGSTIIAAAQPQAALYAAMPSQTVVAASAPNMVVLQQGQGFVSQKGAGLSAAVNGLGGAITGVVGGITGGLNVLLDGTLGAVNSVVGGAVGLAQGVANNMHAGKGTTMLVANPAPTIIAQPQAVAAVPIVAAAAAPQYVVPQYVAAPSSGKGSLWDKFSG